MYDRARALTERVLSRRTVTRYSVDRPKRGQADSAGYRRQQVETAAAAPAHIIGPTAP